MEKYPRKRRNSNQQHRNTKNKNYFSNNNKWFRFLSYNIYLFILFFLCRDVGAYKNEIFFWGTLSRTSTDTYTRIHSLIFHFPFSFPLHFTSDATICFSLGNEGKENKKKVNCVKTYKSLTLGKMISIFFSSHWNV